MRALILLFATIALPLTLSGCGLRPLYGGGTHGAVAQGLGRIDVSPIEGKGGWLVRNALNDRFAPITSASQGPTYRLDVVLSDQITGSGVRQDDSVTRERRILRARYQLFDGATGVRLLDATAGSDAGIDVTSSEYATIAAEDTALERLAQTIADQIVTRLAQRTASEQAAARKP
ncbi:LPS assembly lipoprotein LptE [Sphingobium subterraneum]|uniref:LPS-assembly lipoprotein n=1 Tax=Sphingobium subterraneum TaxID=627688 RepID=A0A841J6E3_9SPHN|nr:LPS assembly lipoprotein LptE [Sphingobium subterraneum]MBB6124105.1 LPS-assembly lipoprotein [Sphingobium subterraneum]